MGEKTASEKREISILAFSYYFFLPTGHANSLTSTLFFSFLPPFSTSAPRLDQTAVLAGAPKKIRGPKCGSWSISVADRENRTGWGLSTGKQKEKEKEKEKRGGSLKFSREALKTRDTRVYFIIGLHFCPLFLQEPGMFGAHGRCLGSRDLRIPRH